MSAGITDPRQAGETTHRARIPVRRVSVRRLALILIVMSAGGAPVAAPAAPGAKPRLLSLRAAINDALATNVQTRVAKAGQSQAAGHRITARSAFLPHLSADVTQARQRVNLAAEGLDLNKDLNFNLPGFSPLITYNSFQARAELRQKVFDYSAWERYQGAKIGEGADTAKLALARQQVASKAERDYVSALAARATVSAARADLKLADRLLKLARDQAHVGMATGVDITRAATRVARTQARLAQTKTERTRAVLQLERTTGLPLDTPLTLSDRLSYRSIALRDVHAVLARALADRAEIRLAKARIRRGEKQLAAAHGERLPKLSLRAAYGTAGNTLTQNDDGTYRVGARLSLPIFDGGAIHGDIETATAALDAQRSRYRDTRRQVEQDVRMARRALVTLGERVHAARSGLKLAKLELKRARDRFAKGVGDNVAVIDAQSALADARKTRINALAEHARARINLAAALGRAPQFDLQQPPAQ